MKLPKISPVLRITLGLVSLVTSLLLILDVAGLVPDHLDMTRQMRDRTSESLAVQAASLMQGGNLTAMARTFEEVRSRDPQIRSIAVRENGGRVIVSVGEHGRHWEPQEEGRSTIDHVQVPVFANNAQWGQVEISFQPAMPTTLLGWVQYPLVQLLLAMAILGFIAFYLYMRRALQYLDPASAVPERVRHAFDTLTEGIVVLDNEGKIMLTNKAFAGLHPDAEENSIGRKIADQHWLSESLAAQGDSFPWDRALQSNEAQSGVICSLKQPSGRELNLIIQASPITDPRGMVRGCLISFNDVTQLHQINDELRKALDELETSREQVRRQNDELQLLASRDPLTGCLNRRAFFDLLEDHFVAARDRRKKVCCIMTDIDHFKQFNDRYGHAVGDDVIRAIAHTLQAALRGDDLLCRYGGEEFCIILPNTDLDRAVEIAKRLRAEVELHAGAAVHSAEGLKVTSSFGVAEFTQVMRDPAELIDRADAALYQSKNNGRNRVTIWNE